MASARELAERYARELRASRNRRAKAQEIARRIKGLVYENTQDPISSETVREILDELRDIFEGAVTLEGIHKRADNQELLGLVSIMSSLLKV